MKKLLVVCVMSLGLVTSASATYHPKLDAVYLTPQTEFTIPQFCDKFGVMLTGIVKLALERGNRYTVNAGEQYVNNALQTIAVDSKLKINENWKFFARGVLPNVPTAASFKERFKGVQTISENERFQIYNLGLDTCLESLEIMQAEENSLQSN